MKSAKQAKAFGRGIATSLLCVYAICSVGFAIDTPGTRARVSGDASISDKALLTWFDLLRFVAEAVCDVVDCTAQNAGDRSNTADEAESIVRGIIDAYTTHGVHDGLTPDQAVSGLATIDAAIWLLDDPASLLAPELSEQFRATLVAIRSDLESVASGRTLP